MNKRRKITLGVDLMGSDASPEALLQALSSSISSLPKGVDLLAIGQPEFEKKVAGLSYYPAPEVIEMDEAPLSALRRKRKASICVGVRLLKAGTIDAFISAGNTGALVSCAKMVLSTFPGIHRPALIALMPTKKNPVAVLDVGANVQAKTSHLLQFAKLGAAYQMARGIQAPSIGILNIGSEAVKGTSELRTAYHQLQTRITPPLRFAGNIEGKSVFDGEVDVLVTDGFTGNIFLKTAEGTATLILDQVYTHIPSAELKKLKRLHYTEYPGALLVGVKGIVIKCHGYSTPGSFAHAVVCAADLARERVVETIESKLHKFQI